MVPTTKVLLSKCSCWHRRSIVKPRDCRAALPYGVPEGVRRRRRCPSHGHGAVEKRKERKKENKNLRREGELR